MWVMTVHSKSNTKIFEFETEDEVLEAYKRIQGYKIITEVIGLDVRDSNSIK
ncbi:hypothetical protein [Metabacillus litoralis]|uniref:hypothetical protein n=1 Tax=Metabacillus litoralis TaxID=152268 RepID=UPI00203B9AB8|nr:hypothetical protein [Metabacillus litoralis]MCM3411836.1 hypothetical protein [Metabacillus litoralis]